jgi:outer membrane lipoprotein carrier protein
MNLINNIITTTLIFTFALLASPQDKGKEFLDAVQTKFKSINNLSADLKQSINDKPNLSSKIYYAKGNKLRIELKNTTIISDGTDLWNYNESQKKVIINNVSSSEPTFYNLDKFVYDYPSKSDVTAENEGNSKILILTPRNTNEMKFKKAKIWVNKENLITKILIDNLSGGHLTLQLSNYKLNQNLPDSTFTFSPPEGTNIIDLRK